MNIFIQSPSLSSIFPLVLLVLVLSAGCSRPSATVTVFTGATLYDGTGSEAIANSVIVVRGDAIDCAGSASDCRIPAEAEIVDASGKYITPGLVDAHVHFLQTGFFDGRPDAMDLRDTYPYPETAAYQKNHTRRYFDAYLCSGVTSVYDVGGLTWSIDLQQSAERNPRAPHVAAAGPLVTHSPRPIMDTPAERVMIELQDEESGRKAVRYLTSIGSTGIKVWFLGIRDAERQKEIDPRVHAVGDEVRKQGNRLIVHATGLREAKVALEAGAELLVHSVSDREVDEAFLSMAKANGTIYTPTLVVGSGYMKAYRAAGGIAPFPIDDPNGCVDEKTRQMLRDAGQFSSHPRLTEGFKERLAEFDPEEAVFGETTAVNLRKIHKAGIPVAVGTDAGNPGTLHGISIYDEMEAMQQAGISPGDLIVMATLNGARAMGRNDELGSIEAGKIADLIVLDDNPGEDITHMRSITHVMIKGELIKVNEIHRD